MRFLTLLVFVSLFTSCADDDVLTKITGAPCYVDPDSQEMYVGASALVFNIGACQSGRTVEDEAGMILCAGAGYPTFEGCDGVDNDCDGAVDEVTNESYSPDNPCLQCGKCGRTREICVDAEWKCDYVAGAPSSDDNCNGVDDDCDCETDEDYQPDLVLCYEYDVPETVLCGSCRAGYEGCIDGRIECLQQVTPTSETCNGVDDDCDCIIDNTDEEVNSADIVIAIDTSGSMASVIDSVAAAVCLFSMSEDSDVFRFALNLIATPDYGYSLVLNFTSATELCSELLSINIAGTIEPTLTANRDIVDTQYNPLMLDWREDARHVMIGFGDEEAQAVGCGEFPSSNCLNAITDEIIGSCIDNNVVVYWFQSYVEYYQDIAYGCGGEFFFLLSNPEYILDQLNSVFEDLCIEEYNEESDD